MTARTRFCQLALALLGKPVLWGAKGPDAVDCSGSVTSSLLATGGPDLRQTHNAQRLFNEAHQLAGADPLPGDLIFYGPDAQHVEHVAILLAGGKVLSADGAQPSVHTIEEALQHATYRVRLHATYRVRLHDDAHFRRDIPAGNPLAVRRNHWVDDLDLVSR